MRYDGERETAEDIINTIVGRAPFVTQFQMERREGKNIEATSAGEGLITELQRRVDKLQNIVEKLQAELTEEMRKNTAATEALRKSHKEDVQDLKNELKSSREAQENLRKYLKSWWWRRWGWW